MSRIEFTAKTKDQAWERSGGACEGYGVLYGLAPGVRCGDDMTIKGVRYDHINPDALSKDNSLANCCACCPVCHAFKTEKHDVPRIAKGKRQQKAARGIRPRQSRPMPGSKASGWKKPMNGPAERRT